MKSPGGYRDRVVERLRATVESRGSSVAAVEKQLGRGRGYVADALRGGKKLSVETILEVLDVVGVPPEDFFERPPRRAGWAGEVSEPPAEGLQKARPGALPAALRDASPLLLAVVLLLTDRGVLTLDELQAMQRELVEPSTSAPRQAR